MKLRKMLTLSAAVILMATLVLSGCNQQDEPDIKVDSLQRVLNTGKLTVVGSGGYRPFNYISEDGSVIGFDVDTGEEIAKRLGVELDYVTSDWDGLTEGLRAGRYDAILGSMAKQARRCW